MTAYAEWVLGSSRTTTAPFVLTEIDTETRALFARNVWNTAFGGRVAFFDLAGKQSEWTGDRREFIGRNGVLAAPAGLAEATALSGNTGAGLDPCGALRTFVQLRPGEEVEVSCFLGQAADAGEARQILDRYRSLDLDDVLAEVRRGWEETLGAVQVRTPDRAMDILLNGWLLYQTLACRIFARSGFYQASGAYGFRDQLQDGMAISGVRPDITRAHILRSAGRQFVEGDVQHWWLPHSGQGVRTNISDDRAWLAYATAHYIDATGDTAILDEQMHFIEGPRLAPGEHDSFFQPHVSGEVGSLFEHCALALDRSLALGAHGLPLIGTGDWNDGMNRVGERGQGESVWLGWFLYAALAAFIPLAEARGDAKHAKRWRAHAAALKTGLESAGWDGEWYRRGYFDDGTPLGSATSAECRIDSIVQSWAVLSGSRRSRKGRPRHGGGGPRTHSPGQPTGSALHPAVRQDAARSRLHQGLSTGHPRERRPIHPRRPVGGDGLRAHSVMAMPRRSCSACSTRSTAREAGPASCATRSSLTSSLPMFIQIPGTRAAAAGPGTPVPPAGCSAPGSKAFLVWSSRVTVSGLIRASPRIGRGLLSPSVVAKRHTKSRSRIRPA